LKHCIAFLVLLILVAPASLAKATTAEQIKIAQQVKDFMAKEDIPALAIAIIQNGEVVFTSAQGVIDRNNKQLITPKTLFQIGSHSKPLTSIIALELVKQGKLKLSDRVIDLLPNVFPEESLAQFNTLTVEHLMVHRSGLPNYPENVTRIDGDAFLGGYTEEMLLSALSNIELGFTPDDKWQYANFNYAVLGYVLSQLTDKNYAQLVKEYVTDKYQLSDTQVNLSEHQINTSLATPYRKDKRQVATQAWDMGLLTPHGGVYSTIDDLAHLMELQIAAYSQYYDSGLTSPLVSTQIKFDTQFTQGGTSYPGLSYGLGMFEAAKEFPMFSETVLFHGGDLDGFGSEYRFAPAHGVGVVMLTSSGGREFVKFAMQIMEELLESEIKLSNSKAN
jgi:CubicO group peptidase (beta-lactamase class C family)